MLHGIDLPASRSSPGRCTELSRELPGVPGAGSSRPRPQSHRPFPIESLRLNGAGDCDRCGRGEETFDAGSDVRPFPQFHMSPKELERDGRILLLAAVSGAKATPPWSELLRLGPADGGEPPFSDQLTLRKIPPPWVELPRFEAGPNALPPCADGFGVDATELRPSAQSHRFETDTRRGEKALPP